MFDHIAEFIRILAVPAILIPAGLDDEDIAFVNFDLVHDHLWSVNTGIADNFGDISDNAGTNPIFEGNLTDGAAIGIEVFLAIHMGAEVDAGVADGAIASHAEVLSANTLGVGDDSGERSSTTAGSER